MSSNKLKQIFVHLSFKVDQATNSNIGFLSLNSTLHRWKNIHVLCTLLSSQFDTNV